MSQKNEYGIDLDLKHSQIMCDLHRSPFLPVWPRGLSVFGQQALLELADVPSFARGVEAHSIDTGCGTVKAIGGLLNRVPVCCRLRHHILFEIYRNTARTTALWGKRNCDLCGGYEYGFDPVDRTMWYPSVQVPPHPHICIRCVSYV